MLQWRLQQGTKHSDCNYTHDQFLTETLCCLSMDQGFGPRHRSDLFTLCRHLRSALGLLVAPRIKGKHGKSVCSCKCSIKLNFGRTPACQAGFALGSMLADSKVTVVSKGEVSLNDQDCHESIYRTVALTSVLSHSPSISSSSSFTLFCFFPRPCTSWSYHCHLPFCPPD